MSDFFRIPKLPGLEAMTLRELARQCHIAENTNDDILLMNVQDELQRRENALGRTMYSIDAPFMEHYRELWTEFAKPKRKGRST